MHQDGVSSVKVVSSFVSSITITIVSHGCNISFKTLAKRQPYWDKGTMLMIMIIIIVAVLALTTKLTTPFF